MSNVVLNAYADFAYNVGVAKFCGSTLVRRYHAGYDDEACAQLSRWNLAGGRTLTGLVRRRAVARALSNSRPPPSPSPTRRRCGIRLHLASFSRSEARRVRKECVRTCRPQRLPI